MILAIYAAIFLAQYRKKEEGTIIDFENFKNCRNGGFGVRVRLVNGKEARATVGGCTVCLNNLEKGSKVRLLKLKDKDEYVITQSTFESLKSMGKENKCHTDSAKKTA